MSRVLVIEDNANLAYGLQASLELEGHQVDLAGDGADGLRRALDTPPDLVVLDLMLPGMDGYRVLKAIREAGLEAPVLILTARGEEADKVMGFRLGADDYVTKPFGLLELLARVGALLRRTRAPAPGGRRVEQVGELEIDPFARSVRRAGREVTLSPKELDLLLALLHRKGAAAGRLELLAEVWAHRAAVRTRTVDMHVAQLRRKLEEDPANPRHIITVWKAGYRLER